MDSRTKLWVFMGAIAALLVAAALLPVAEWVGLGLAWVEANKGISWAVFIIAYILATVFMVPGSLLTLGAGFVFGLPVGVVLVSVSSVTGAAAAFLTGRFFARDWLAHRIEDMPRFNALDKAIGNKGFLVCLLTRLSPVFPFNLLNYALGLTRLRFVDYFFASWIGMFPGTVAYVYLGSAAKDLASILSGEVQAGGASRWLLWLGLGATLLLTVLITRIATQSLKTELDTEEPVVPATEETP